jgi:hypothetical protein
VAELAEPRKKGYYVDNHEKPETVAYRRHFIKRHLKFEDRMFRWVQLPLKVVKEMEENEEIEGELGHRYRVPETQLDMIADLASIHQRRQVLIDKGLLRSNMKRRSLYYEVGQRVLLFPIKKLGKMQGKAFGPFAIIQTHVNGNVTLQRGPHITERVNI